MPSLTDQAACYPLRTIPGYCATRPGVQIGTYISSKASDEDLQFLQQLGVEWGMVIVDGGAATNTVENYARLRERLGRYGIQIYRIANHSVHNMDQVVLNLPGRDEKIEEFLAFIRNLGRAGIHYNTLGYVANGIWSTGHTTMRGGVVGRHHGPERCQRLVERRGLRRAADARTRVYRGRAVGELYLLYQAGGAGG